MATEFRGSSVALLWNGTRWNFMSPAPKHVITAPSCPGSHMCAVINGAGFLMSGAIAETWNGQAWKSWRSSSFCRTRPSACGGLDVSCAKATMCVDVGSRVTRLGASLPAAAVWNGSDWAIKDPPRAADAFASAVSCTGTACLTVGDRSKATAYVASYDFTSGTWKNISSAARLPWNAGRCGGACFLPGTLSCASSRSCMTSGLGGFFAWNGREFKRTHPVSAGRGSKLTRVSCVKGFCMAVGYRTVNGVRRPLSEIWNGTTWRILRQG